MNIERRRYRWTRGSETWTEIKKVVKTVFKANIRIVKSEPDNGLSTGETMMT